MRPFTISQFRTTNFEIPNLHPDYKMEVERVEDHYGRVRTFRNYYIKGSAIPLTANFAVDNDEWYLVFKISGNGYISD